MALGGIYNAGTVTIASGGVLITGVGTAWSLNKIEIGDWLFCNGQVGGIAAVTDDTHLSLETAWIGTLPSAAAYFIAKMSWLRYDPALTQKKLRELLDELEAQGTFVFTDVAPPDPTLGTDGQWALQTNVTPWRMWYHTGGVWVEQASPGGGIAWKGAYNPATDYASNNAVSYTGSSYVAKVDPPSAGIPPTNTTYWDVLAQKGDPGPTGPAGPQGVVWRGDWNSATAYVPQDAVQFGGASYIAIANNTNSQPPSANWNLLAQSGTANILLASDYPSLQAAINAAKAMGGATIQLIHGNYNITSTLLIDGSNIVLRGYGSGMAHDGGSAANDMQTTITWTGAAGGTMVRFKPTFSATSWTLNGCSINRIALIGNQLAATGLEVNSVKRSYFFNLYIADVTAQAVLVTCGTSGTDTGDAADTQYCRFERISWRMIDFTGVRNAHGFVLTGTANANTNYCTFIDCDGQVYNGTCWRLVNCDSNEFFHCLGHIVTGTGLVWDVLSPSAYGGIGVGGSMHLYSCATGTTAQSIIRQGSVGNIIIAPDTGNGSQVPTRQANTELVWLACGGNPQLLLGNYVNLYSDETTTGAATIKAEPNPDTTRRFHANANMHWFGTDATQPVLKLTGTTVGTGVEVASAAAGTGATLAAISTATNEPLVVKGKGTGGVTVGVTGGPAVTIPAGLNVSGDWAVIPAINAQGGRKSIVNGGSAYIAQGYPTIGIVMVCNTNSQASALCWLAGGVPLIIHQDGTEYTSGNTPAAGKTGIGFTGGSYALFNNTGSTNTYGVMLLMT